MNPIHVCSITYKKIPLHGTLLNTVYEAQLCLISAYMALGFSRDFEEVPIITTTLETKFTGENKDAELLLHQLFRAGNRLHWQ